MFEEANPIKYSKIFQNSNLETHCKHVTYSGFQMCLLMI